MGSVEKQDVNSSGWRTLIILSCLGLIVMFDETMILPAIPDFIRDFHISYSTSSWILASYIIAGAVMTPIAGKLSDIYGKKKILLIVMAVYAMGILSGRFAHSIEIMVAARVAQGVGMAMFPIAFGIIREVLPEKKLAIGQTIFSSTFSGGAVIGLVAGAAIIQNFGWQATFLAILPAAIALLLVIVKFVHVRHIPMPTMEAGGSGNLSNAQKIDIKGTLALAATIVTFLAGISLLETNSDNSVYQLAGLFAASGASLAAFIAIEKRVQMPLLDLKIMTSKLFLPPVIVIMLVFMSMFMVYQTIPVMVRSPEPLGFGGDAITSARVQLPFMIVLLAGTIMSGFLLNKVGNVRLLLIGTAISTMGFFSLLAFHSTEDIVSVGLGIIAAGLSLSITGAFNVILLSVPMQVTGIALGMAMLLNLVGMSIGPSFAGMFQQMDQGTVPGVPGTFPTEAAYNMIFLTAALVSIASVVMALSVARRKIAPAVMTGEQREADKGGFAGH
ncbi:arabinose efflux permease family protein [Candidatus Nitrososphaera evergladensis SR1]|uniref:Arabinose efflux permease family protein n=1 Tax=Candidatus Nitrososphaera evergladensis SR1 TaxID=1459636 RepID=A0A075MUK3_9ARCH|nr:MFS transporter [Candidatus Nitrososphaera evergladensis]AIF84900.1 arabinose efflux permease family protein [Candidatus Nitrososphaera evergladensis SR1]